jgi:predicted acyl esterase
MATMLIDKNILVPMRDGVRLATDVYRLDGANASGPRDQREVELRDDVLVYSTPALDRPVEVTGPIELHLFVASSARDMDFTGKLVDVHPDGRAMILTEGILRALPQLARGVRAPRS